jgi:hypothetical protein
MVMSQEDNRRGFITSGAGIGVFVAAAFAPSVSSAAPISGSDVLLAMPGERYYAIPKADLERYSVSVAAFVEEEARRLPAAAVSKDGSRRPPRPPPVMGVRG